MKTIAKILGGFIALIVILLLIICERDRPVEELIPLYANKDSKFMPIMGMKVHYRDEGVATDTLPLILLHGMSSSLNTWDSVVISLKAHKRVISLDLPGFALTGPSPEMAYNFPYYSKFIDSFATRLKIKRFILAGNSLGGAISWNYALHNPSRLAKMILIDAAGYPKKGESGSLGFKLASTPVINNLLLYATPKALVRKSLETVYYDPASVTDEQVERFHDVAIREGNREAALMIFKGSFKGNPESIKEVKTPTLILWGDKDNLIGVNNVDNFLKDIKGSKAEIYKNVGHVPMEEVPGKVAASILKFVQ
ncbi:alpha/beta fold hydrolase [Aquirufa antheringensis]|jgi:pimeloyl-ACP methyl ester carboxylesterase|uniref:Alpha/beta hydrolase n=1 Tax=Aquirufa antheringensis TaxID=2516559 RepID=A0A4V2IW30_9BACT|nr:alpha/beta hydrolase [Aquirufa antheringensis]MCZ2484275.1 alpha/beta hydrolase [Aquirufa antheringensis]MCZ2487856.1 alpha/beta hydrolase [Aquirufa antheringensis]TBH74515.1 alpha/beta hydrolase [Aquirufa antheringensis]